MNAYAIVILVALLVDAALRMAADVLNLRALRPELPAELAGAYDAERYARSQEYTRARTRFGIVSSAFDLLVLLAFWGLGGFGWLDGLVRSLGWGPVPTGVAYIGALLLGARLLDLPFSLYSTFVIEERFGFNRTTPRTFLLDLLRGLLLVVLLGAPLLAAVLFFFERTGEAAWLLCWLVTALFSLFVVFISPTWILPLFNRFEPLAEGELREAILGYARANSFPLQGVFVMDGSRRSTKANALFTGFGRSKRVLLYDTLVEGHSTPELVAVVAHEVGHYKRRHILKGLVVQLLHFGLLFWLLSIFLQSDGLFAAFGMDQRSVYAGLVFFGLLFTPIELALSFVLQAFARRHEYQADEFAAHTTGDPEPLVQALMRLSAENLSNLTPHPFHVVLNHSHPPLLARIRALRAAAG